MKRALAIVTLPAALALGACGGGDAAKETAQTCQGQFEATVHRGPSKGLSIKGRLALRIEPSGHASGALRQNDGSRVTTVGQVDGRAISLAIDAGKSGTLYGTGAARDADVSACKGEIGGSFAGPRPGDDGDWGFALGG
jgi:hypothetical protein